MQRRIDLHFLHSGFTPYCTARVDKYFEGYFTLQFMTTGGIELYYEHQQYALQGAWFWPAYPGPHIRFHPGCGHPHWEHRYVAFRGPLVDQWRASGLWFDQPQQTLLTDDHRRCFDDLLSFVQRSDGWSHLRAINLLERLLIDLAEMRSTTQSNEGWLETVFAYLAQQEWADLEYPSLARLCHMGESTFRRRFKAATGFSLHHYVLEQRMHLACRYLSQSALSVKEIAYRLGYHDVSFFSRQFHAHQGCSPSLYRTRSDVKPS